MEKKNLMIIILAIIVIACISVGAFILLNFDSENDNNQANITNNTTTHTTNDTAEVINEDDDTSESSDTYYNEAGDMPSEEYEYHYSNQFGEYVRFDPDVYVIDPSSGLPYHGGYVDIDGNPISL